MKVSSYFYFALGVFTLLGCGNKPGLQVSAARSTTTVTTPTTPVTVPVYQSGCSTPLSASIYFSPAQPTVGSPVQVNLSAQGCNGLYEFVSASAAQSLPSSGLVPWSGSTSFSYTFTQTGTQTLSVVVNAVTSAGVIMQSQTLSGQVNVQAAAQASTTPVTPAAPVTPPPVPPTCSITRLTPVTQADAFATVVLSVTGNPVSFGINGLMTLPGVPFNLAPTAAGSGRYIALGQVAGTSGQASCGLAFDIPTVKLEITQTTTSSVNYQITINGPVNKLTLDGTPIALPPPPINVITGTLARSAPGRGNLVAVAENTVTGDRTSSAGSFCVPHAPLALTQGNTQSVYMWTDRFAIDSSSGSAVGVGWGAGQVVFGTRQFFTTYFNQPILQGAEFTATEKCGPNSVQVGLVNDSVVICRPLISLADGAAITLTNPTTKTYGWTYGATRSCDTGDVMVGSGVGKTHCATPAWNECK